MLAAFDRLAEGGYISTGPPDGMIDPPPYAACAAYTRSEFATVMARALRIDPTPSLHPFSDIDGHWAEGSIGALHQRGLLLGYPDGTFGPEDPVTLAQVKLVLARALGLPGNLTLETADEALRQHGRNTDLPDGHETEPVRRGQVFLLLDRIIPLNRLESEP